MQWPSVIRQRDQNERTLLHHAAAKGNLNIVKLLLANNASKLLFFYLKCLTLLRTDFTVFSLCYSGISSNYLLDLMSLSNSQVVF